MANVIREKRVINGQTVIIEIDNIMDQKIHKYVNASAVQEKLGLNLDAASMSTVGAGKRTRSTQRNLGARNYKR